MKKIFFLLILVVFLLSTFSGKAYADLFTPSNKVVTRVGEGSSDIIPISQTSCPIPGTRVTCGSAKTPRNNCGHCGLNYGYAYKYCGYAGNDHAIDMYGWAGTAIYLPSINGHVIQWTHVGTQDPDSMQQAQLYSGTDDVTGEIYWLEFHHTLPKSGNLGTHRSGELAGKVSNKCLTDRSYCHTHMQIAFVNSSGKKEWIDAAKTFCLGQ